MRSSACAPPAGTSTASRPMPVSSEARMNTVPTILASVLLIRCRCAVLATVAAVLPTLAEPASAQVPRPLQAAQVEGPCADSTYPDCRRLRFSHGPITVAPGNNAQYLARSIDKPSFDGYVTRIQADMVRAEDGRPPPTEQLMLH